MTIGVCGRLNNGVLLGEDENGNLYTGVVQQVLWTDVVRTVSDVVDGQRAVTFTYGNQVVASATLDAATDPGDYSPVPGETVPVTEWTAI